MTAADLPAVIETVAALLTVVLVMTWMGPEQLAARRRPANNTLPHLLSLLFCNAILEILSLRLRGALWGSSRLSRMSQNSKLPALPGNVRSWRGSHYRDCDCQSDDPRHSEE